MKLNSVFLRGHLINRIWLRLAKTFRYCVFSICAITLSACNNQSSTLSTPDVGVSPNTNAAITTVPSSGPTTVTPTPTATPIASTGSYPSCISSDPTFICIGLKIVSYQTSAGVPILTEAEALTLVAGINQVWSQCNIGFQLEVFQIIDPTTVGLPYSPDWDTQTNAIREAFADNTRFLVAAVGSETGSTIAVTMMPNSGVYGSIIDSAYAQNPLTVGHELGHYQGLYHVSDTTNLLNPYIGPDTKTLTASQCATARSTDAADWVAMERNP